MNNYSVTVIYIGGKTTYTAKEGKNLLELLSENGYYINAACGGKKACGKCGVKLVSGRGNYAVDGKGNILSCKAYIYEDITVEVPLSTGEGLTFSASSNIVSTDGKKGFGIALDIGTTTLAFYLLNTLSGEEIASYSCLNPQGVYGADVISRIDACKNGKLKELNGLIIKRTNETIKLFKTKYGIAEINKVTVCGNTVMLHLFANEDASSIGEYPFKPKFTEKRQYNGTDLSIDAAEVVLMPSVSAYVGSDITAGILSTGMTKNENSSLLIDIGTNGEIVLFCKGKLYCSSTAAGPAFEGANIACGTGGVSGAISSAKYDAQSGNISCNVIGGGKAVGICGSGLIDLIALMLKNGVIDETGAFDYVNAAENLKTKMKDGKFYITENVFLSQKDVREYQLAKSSICAGIKTLAGIAEFPLKEIDKVYIAGGMGFYINAENAFLTGLLPDELNGKTEAVGNSAGQGAKLCLLSDKYLSESSVAATTCKSVELSQESMFFDEYISNMQFKTQN